MTLRERLGRELLFFDGGMGTLLQQRGLPPGALPETWNLLHPDAVEDIHAAYLEAGCHILKTNTFGANAHKLADTPYRADDVIRAGIQRARAATRRTGRADALVALDIGPSGQLLAPLGDLGFEDAVALFGEMVAAGAAAGADMVLLETFSDTYEVKAAVLAAKERSDLPVAVTLMFDPGGRLLTGGDIPAAVALLEGLGVDAIGLNCGCGPAEMAPLIAQLRGCCSLPLVCNPNAGLPRAGGANGMPVYDLSPEDFAAAMRPLVASGVWAAGGCCGTTPAHIAALTAVCADVLPAPPPRHTHTAVSSYARAVRLDDAPVIIGERINPTGKKRFQQALREGDIAYLLREGVTQQQNGAQLLDVNVGLPDIDEAALLPEVAVRLQEICDLPLQLDTSDYTAMERAMRLYNGKPMLNSVSGKAASMAAVFPLMKRYGGVAVVLTLDEAGIPPTARGRLEVARRIVETAASHGIEKRDIVVDVLTMALSAQPDAAAVTLEAVRLVRQELGVGTVLGVSNISFGLPAREHINAAFYTMALHSGLTAAILNPNIPAMMNAYSAYCALMGHDAHCLRYIERHGGEAAAPPPPAADYDLAAAIRHGLAEQAHAAALTLCDALPPLEVVETVLIPALNGVGTGFEAGTVFLPQLLMSAEAAKAAFEAVQSRLPDRDAAGKGTVVLATVQGDIHDIGKNIARVLLENYGYRVVDLGRDVPPQAVADAVTRENASLAGLSALMTTTVPAMAATVALLRERAPGCRVMVGGAVLTANYAAQIGADYYCKDAMAGVRYAGEVYGG